MSEGADQQKILIVDDDAQLVLTLQYQLEALEFNVVATGNGSTALDLYHQEGPFSVIVLDINLQGKKDGLTLLEEIRHVDRHTGILMLSARNASHDKIKGLKHGADDYLCKPFNEEELITRISRIASRSELIGTADHFTGALSFGSFQLDQDNLILHTPQGPRELTTLEMTLLCTLIRYSGKVLTREFLLRNVWGVSGDVETRTVDNFIVRLRKLLEEDPAHPRRIVSVRGRGYKFIP